MMRFLELFQVTARERDHRLHSRLLFYLGEAHRDKFVDRRFPKDPGKASVHFTRHQPAQYE